MKNNIRSILMCGIIIAAFNLTGCGGASNSDSSGGGGNNSTSQSGSTAAMLTHGDALYILKSGMLTIYDITSADVTVEMGAQSLRGAETLFIYEDYLYVGGSAGVDILNIEDPFYPVQVSTYEHLRACDPVVVSAGVGYVTLRNRAGCGGDINRLEVVDFTDPLRPSLVETFPMDFPFGLAKTDEYLAICQQEYGLSLLDVTLGETSTELTATINETVRFFDVHCFDLIAASDSLIATATDGIYQFDIDGITIVQLSKIPVGSEDVSL